jgi:hypothetical protein
MGKGRKILGFGFVVVHILHGLVSGKVFTLIYHKNYPWEFLHYASVAFFNSPFRSVQGWLCGVSITQSRKDSFYYHLAILGSV